MDDPAGRARLALLVSQAVRLQKSAPLSRLRRASLAHQAKLASQARKDHPATLVQRDNQATQAKMDRLALLVRKDHPVHPATLAQMAHEATPEFQQSALRLLLVTPDPRDPTDHQAQPATLDHAATTVPQEPLVPKDHQAPTEHPAKMALPAIKARLDRTVPRENRVFARNIALWTAASSSKMAQDVNRTSTRLTRRRSISSCLQSRSNGYGESLLLLAIHPFLSFLYKPSFRKVYAFF
jgi:hypothetical protein